MGNIKRLADQLARRHRSRNPFEIIKGLNVILVFTPLTGIRGFYQYFQRNNIIYIDSNLPREEQHFVCAHELGHMLLHKKYNAVFMDSRTFMTHGKYEKEANLFAADLLISDEMVIEATEQGYTVRQFARLIGCCEELVKLRLADSEFSAE